MKKFICLSLFLINVCVAAAQISPMPPSTDHNHDHEGNTLKADLPPHGGVITESGKYNIEVLFDPFAVEQKVTIWLLSQRNKIKSLKGAQATITINYSDGRSTTNEMKLLNNSLVADVKDILNSFNAIVIVSLNKKKYTSTFYFKGLNK